MAECDESCMIYQLSHDQMCKSKKKNSRLHYVCCQEQKRTHQQSVLSSKERHNMLRKENTYHGAVSTRAKTTNQSTFPVTYGNQSSLLRLISTNWLIFIFIHVLLAHQSESLYGVCNNVTAGEPMACQPSAYVITRLPDARISLDPPTATCGNPQSTWIRLGDRSETVNTCNANDQALRHPPEYMLDEDTSLFWQSINQSPGTDELNINITLSFNKLFRLSGDVIIKFNSGRPNKMILEKSVDNGATWQVWQYYQRNCQDLDGVTSQITTENPTAVTCTNRYVETTTRTSPGREVLFATQEDRFDLFVGNPPENFNDLYIVLDTQSMVDFLLFTDIRINLIEPATDGRGTYDRYHYGISRIQVLARCFCNLHASSCNYTDTEVVCDCQHNTQGKDCESCLPLYNDRPWSRGSFLPYSEGTAFECTKCECYDHARSCTYNATYGRGTCDVCFDNTRGNHCELCDLGYYPNASVPLNAEDRCLACDCEAIGVTDLSLPCDQELTGTVLGQCPCRQGISGRRCDECLPGFFGLFITPVGTCESCECNLDGTEEQNNTCSQIDGQCICKVSTTGRACDQCADGFYSFPRGSPQRGCFPCNCDDGGSLSQVCDKETGICQCRTGLSGEKCGQTQTGSYIPAIDINVLQPADSQTSGQCTVTSDLWTSTHPFDGTSFAVCPVTSASDTIMDFEQMAGAMMQLALQWPYYVAVRYTSVSANITGVLTVEVVGNTQGDLTSLSSRLGQVISPGCPFPGGPFESIDINSFPPGQSTAVMLIPTLNLDARCAYSFSLTVRKDTPAPTLRRKKRALTPTDEQIFIDSLVFFPKLMNTDGSQAYTLYSSSDNTNKTTEDYMACLERVADLKEKENALVDASCYDNFFAVGSELYDGALPCECNDIGSHITSSCATLGGQCVCARGVAGRACNQCKPGYYNFTSGGCSDCNCYPTGAEMGACDTTTGQCPCLTNVALLTTSVPGVEGQPATTPFDGTCSRCLPNYYGIDTGEGCTACDCSADGSLQLQCEETGLCICKDSVVGDKCGTCREQYYGFGPQGCSACNCSESGSQTLDCDLTTGLCTCKSNVQGDKCADCKVNFFNMEMDNPKGCQPCFCFNHGTDCSSASGFQKAFIETSSPPNEDFSMFFGDQHVSYGQHLFMNMTADFVLDVYNEVLITLESNKKKLQHIAGIDTIVNGAQGLEYSVRLWEENWFFVDDVLTQPATSANMYEILADIDMVRPITTAYGWSIQVIYLSLETAKMANETHDEMYMTENVTFVEDCTCLPTANVAGLSCEMCATGNKRQNPPETVTSYDTCVACDCNGRGATSPPECAELTGICLNCRNGTTGDQCELCAGNVTGVECDQCLPEFWGLDTDGCQPCACSEPGSTNNQCATEGGQCECVDHVVGRTCDQCEENYQGLTETGCTKCDSCYDEVSKAIIPLRSLRDDCASNVSLAETQDTTDVNGLFVDRLNQATADTERLVNYLDSAVASETQVLEDMDALNATLLSIMDQLTVIEQNTTNDIEKLLADIETLLDQANAERVSMEAHTKNAYTNLASLEPLNEQLTALVDSLREVERYLQAEADASSSDLQLINDLNRLNHTTYMANLLANQLTEDASAFLDTHQNTSSRLLTLQRSIIATGTRAIEVLAEANTLSMNTQTAEDQVAFLQNQLSELMGYSVDLTPYDTRMNNAEQTTDSYKTQLTAERALFETTNQNALSSVETTEALANQTRTLTTSASDWVRRSKAAEQKSITIVSQSNNVFSEAERSLSTVSNFDTLSQEAKAKADARLSEVTSIHETSKQLIEQSNALSASIASLQQVASSAKLSSQQALSIIQQKQQDLQGVLVQEEQLGIRLNNEMDLSGESYAILENLQDNIVTPASEQIRQVQTRLESYNDQHSAADSTTTEALSQTASVKARANQILIQLRDIDTVNTTVAQQLLEEVGTAVTDTDVNALRLAAQDLQTSSSIQQAEIAQLTSEKNRLRARLQKLQAAVDQLNV